MSTGKSHKSKHKSPTVRNAKSIVKGDVVLLSHKRIGVIHYVGKIVEYIEKGIWYGIEIRMTAGRLGNSNGIIGDTTYFKCANNEGLFVRLHDILRRIEPKELLEKVVKLTKIKTSQHQLLSTANAELHKLKTKFNVSPSHSHTSSKYDHKYSNNSRKHRRKKQKSNGNVRPNFDDNTSGSITSEPSISMQSISDFSIESKLKTTLNNSESDSEVNNSVSNATNDSVVPIQVASPLKARNNNGSQSQSQSFKYQKMEINKGNKPFSLHNSASSPAQSDNAKVHKKNGSHRNSKHFQNRMSLSLTPTHTKRVTFGNEFYDESEMKMSEKQLFWELQMFFTKMDMSSHGKVDLNDFRYILIEFNPDLEPYKLTNDAIKRCFNEFDVTKTGYVTIEEFIIVMGKTYLRGRAKANVVPLPNTEIYKYFTQIIKHFLKKQQKNISYNRKGGATLQRKPSLSRSRTASGSKPPAPPRYISKQRSMSKGRNGARPPPPKRDVSPSVSGKQEEIARYIAHLKEAELQETVSAQQQQIEEFQVSIAQLQDDQKQYELDIKALKEENQMLRIQNIDPSKYKTWSVEQIVAWIISLDATTFGQYEEKLIRTMTEEEVDGEDLMNATADDVKRWGVTKFKNIKILLQHIKELTVMNVNNEGHDAPTAYI